MTASIITFYSFKGGVGRTQAIANVAVSLALKGHDVIVVDMDMESPGLHTYFRPDHDREWSTDQLQQTGGVLDFLEQVAETPRDEPLLHPYLLRCTARQLPADRGTIRLLLPGRLDDEYAARVASFSWEQLYEERCGYEVVEVMRRQLVESGADYVLIDSRTGMTEVAGICTFQLPDVVVAMTAPHHQGIEGIHHVASAIAEARARNGTAGACKLVLLLSRVEEDSEIDLRDYWIRRAGQRMNEFDATVLFEQYRRIPYEARAAFGEPIVVGSPTSSYLADAYEGLSEHLVGLTDNGRPKRAGTAQDSQDSPPAVTAAAVDRLGRHVASTLAELRTLIERELRVVRDELAPSFAEHPKLKLPDALYGTPDTLAECELFARKIPRLVENAWQAWRVAWEERFREELLAAAEGDDTVVEGKLAKLHSFLQVADSDAAQAHLTALAADVRSSSRNVLLARDQLGIELLRQSIPGHSERVRWLQDKLDDAVQVELAGQRSEPARALAKIRNCLRLLVLEEEYEARYWPPYESLCAHSAKDASSEGGDDFESIGIELWCAAWKDYLDSKEPSASVGALPTGQHTRAQLRAALAEFPAYRERLGGVIAAAIVQAWSRWQPQPGGREAFTALLRDWGEDPALLWALKNLPAMASVATRRALSAAYLQAGSFEADIAMYFLRTLIEDGYPAEAFLARKALVSAGKRMSGESLSLVMTALVIHAIEQRDGDSLSALLADTSHSESLTQHDVGRAALIVLAGGLLDATLLSGDVRQQLIVYLVYGQGYLSESTSEWLDWRISNVSWEPDKADKVAQLEETCRALMSDLPVYAKWEPSYEYKRVFEEHWNENMEQLMHDALDDRELAEQAFDRWLHGAAQDLQPRYNRNVEPIPRWRERMHEHFKYTQDAMRRFRDCLVEHDISADAWRTGARLRDECRQDVLRLLRANPEGDGVRSLIDVLSAQGEPIDAV